MTSAAGSRQASASSSVLAVTTSENSRATSTYGSSVPTSAQSQSSNSGYSGSSSMPYFPPLFPKVMKIAERRYPLAPKSVQPYCVQKIIDQAGVPQPWLNTTQQQTIIFLNETEPSTLSQLSGKQDEDRYRDARGLEARQSANSCGCVWLWT